MMTVADLIVQLEQLQQDTPLFLWCWGDYGVYPVMGVELAETYHSQPGDALTITLV